MANLLEQSELQMRQLENLNALMEHISSTLSPYGDCVDIAALEEMAAGFRARAMDFSRKNRKFTLAVIGQVKAGKSSFLNTLLFEGKPLLPRASTPKTTALTCIEYSKNNRVMVEYYTPDEWAGLERLAASPLDTPQARAARETLALAIDLGTPLERCFRKPRETIAFPSSGDMSGWLNSYVGEDGLYAPLVKNVTIFMDVPALRGLSVVDTPGLNDPVISRVEKTRSLIEKTDAVFFLSHSSFFLDRNDLLLLTGLLPYKGVASLTVVGSQFDSALMDTLPDYENLGEALRETRVLLRRHAAKAVDEAIAPLQRNQSAQAVLNIAQQCRRPVFVSALAENAAAGLSCGDTPSTHQQLVMQNLGTPSLEELLEISNFREVRGELADLARTKDKILAAKAQSFAAVLRADLGRYLDEVRGQVQKQVERYRARQAESQRHQQELSVVIREVRTQVDLAFDDYLAPLEHETSAALFYLLELEKEWGSLEERTDYRVRANTKLVSASKLLAPWTWGRKDTIYMSENHPYTYLDPEDLHRNLSALSDAADRYLEAMSARFQDTSGLSGRLMEVGATLLAQNAAVPPKLQVQVQAAVRHLPWAKPLRQPPKLPPLSFEHKVLDVVQRQELQEEARMAVADLLAFYRKRITLLSEHLREESRRAAQELGNLLCADLTRRRSDLVMDASYAGREANRRAEAIEWIERFLF